MVKLKKYNRKMTSKTRSTYLFNVIGTYQRGMFDLKVLSADKEEFGNCHLSPVKR